MHDDTQPTPPEEADPWRTLGMIPLAMLVIAPFALLRAWLAVLTWAAALVPLGAPPIDMAAAIVAFGVAAAVRISQPRRETSGTQPAESLALATAKRGARYCAAWGITYGMAVLWTTVLR
jgi:hypothetical protein